MSLSATRKKSSGPYSERGQVEFSHCRHGQPSTNPLGRKAGMPVAPARCVLRGMCLQDALFMGIPEQARPWLLLGVGGVLHVAALDDDAGAADVAYYARFGDGNAYPACAKVLA